MKRRRQRFEYYYGLRIEPITGDRRGGWVARQFYNLSRLDRDLEAPSKVKLKKLIKEAHQR